MGTNYQSKHVISVISLAMAMCIGNDARSQESDSEHALVNYVTSEDLNHIGTCQYYSGVYMVDMGYSPRDLVRILEDMQLSLQQDGSVTNELGEKLIVTIEEEISEEIFADGMEGPSAITSNPAWDCIIIYKSTSWDCFGENHVRVATETTARLWDPWGNCSGQYSPYVIVDFVYAYAMSEDCRDESTKTGAAHCYDCDSVKAQSDWNSISHYDFPFTVKHTAEREFYGSMADDGANTYLRSFYACDSGC